MAQVEERIWKPRKWSLIVNKTVLTIVLTLLVGIILTHGVDDYISNHDFIYQSPLVIKEHMVSPVVITKEVVVPIATQEAQPAVSPKGLNLR